MEPFHFISVYSTSVIGMTIFAYAMAYYKFKSKFETERQHRIRHKTEVRQLQQELTETQDQLEEKQKEINHLEKDLKTERQCRARYESKAERLQQELTETQKQLHEQRDRSNRLEEKLEAEKGKSKQLQGELDKTQAALQEKVNQVRRLEEKLETEQDRRIRHETEVGRLQQQLTETQKQLHEQRNRSDRLEEKLEAEKEKSEQLQDELNSTKAALQEKVNQVSQLEGNLETERTSRTQLQTELEEYKGKVNHLEENLTAEKRKSEKLQGELAAIQKALDELKAAINCLEKEIKEKSDDQKPEEAGEPPADTDPSPRDKDTEIEPDEKQEKTDGAKREKTPRDIDGRGGEGSGASGDNGDPKPNPKPELVCQKNGQQWEISLVAPQERPPAEVHQNGAALSSPNGEYRLNDFSENLTVRYGNGEAAVELHNSSSPLIFKLRTNWQGEGRKVKRISRGYFIVFAPREWQREGNPPVAAERCSDTEFLAHYFYADDTNANDGFEGHELPSSGEIFSLNGNSIYDDSNQGPLFIGNPPDLKIAESNAQSVSWIRIGEEGGGGWRGENFRPSEKTVREVLSDRQGWFYVRVYDQDVKLIDSDHFRYSKTLKEIQVGDDVYSQETLLVPSTHGYTDTTIQFIDTERNNIHPEQQGNDSHAHIGNSDTVIVSSHPDGDLTKWTVDGVDTVIALPRVWWRITGTEDFSDEWRDTPIVMSRDKFLDHTDAVVHISLPSKIKKIQAGFGDDLDRTCKATADDENENKRIFELPIRDFVDYEEIENPSSTDTYLNVRCNDEVIRIIRVPAEQPSLREIRVNGTSYSEETLLVPPTDGYTDTTIQFVDTEGNSIRPEKIGNNSHASICNDGAVIVEPHPDGDLTKWKVGGDDKVIALPRIWWRITGTEDFSDEWHDKPIVMSRQKFLDNRNAIVQVSLPSSTGEIQARLGLGSWRSDSGTANDRKGKKRIFKLCIHDFAHMEIDNLFPKRTYLEIRCNGKKLRIVHVPGKKECPECGSELTTVDHDNGTRRFYHCKRNPTHWKSVELPLTAEKNRRLQKSNS